LFPLHLIERVQTLYKVRARWVILPKREMIQTMGLFGKSRGREGELVMGVRIDRCDIK
jgi:hypothetical protein